MEGKTVAMCSRVNRDTAQVFNALDYSGFEMRRIVTGTAILDAFARLKKADALIILMQEEDKGDDGSGKLSLEAEYMQVIGWKAVHCGIPVLC